MPLADEIIKLRDGISADLAAAYDYYANTKAAWRIVQRYIEKGGKIKVQIMPTGSLITEKELPGKAQLYITEYLSASTLQQFVSLFEDLLFGLMRLWLLAYPQKIGKKQLQISVVFSATNLDELKLAAVDRELHELSYKNVREWFIYLGEIVKLDCPSPDQIERLAELKATRDVLVHSRGVAGTIYETK